MGEFVIKATEPEPEFEYPHPSDKGQIMFEIEYYDPDGKDWYDRWGIISHGYTGSAFWINEGQGIDYFVKDDMNEMWIGMYYLLGIRHFVIDGIYGVYTRGDGYSTDDDEDWYHDGYRVATDEEIRIEGLPAD